MYKTSYSEPVSNLEKTVDEYLQGTYERGVFFRDPEAVISNLEYNFDLTDYSKNSIRHAVQSWIEKNG